MLVTTHIHPYTHLLYYLWGPFLGKSISQVATSTRRCGRCVAHMCGSVHFISLIISWIRSDPLVLITSCSFPFCLNLHTRITNWTHQPAGRGEHTHGKMPHSRYGTQTHIYICTVHARCVLCLVDVARHSRLIKKK